MKIVHIFWGLTYGGIETMLVNICNEQAKTDNQIHLMIINDCIEQELERKLSSKIKIIKINRKIGSKSFFFIYRLNRNLLKITPDIIHLHRSSIYKYLLPKLRRRVCCTMHALPYGRLCRWNFPWLYLYVALKQNSCNLECMHLIKSVFAISDVVKEQLRENYGIKSITIYNGIPIHQFEKHVFKEHPSVFKLVQVSRLEYKTKGQDLFIQAIQVLSDRGIKNIEVDLIGDGISRKYLQCLIKKCGLADRVRLLGKKPQGYIYHHLCDYDLFIQPSRHEGFGLTVAEAMAANVPVITSAGQGPAEVTCNDKYGWIFHNGNAKNLADTISFVLNHQEEAKSKAEEACLYVEETYDVAITARKYLEAYQAICDQKC